MAQKETNISTKVMMEASKLGLVMFRNNVGMALAISGAKKNWVIKQCIELAQRLNCHAWIIRYGLMKGSGDQIGWRSIIITEDMVGKRFAQFTSLEIKVKGGKVRQEQKTWLENVNNAGGLALIVDDENKLKEMIDNRK